MTILLWKLEAEGRRRAAGGWQERMSRVGPDPSGLQLSVDHAVRISYDVQRFCVIAAESVAGSCGWALHLNYSRKLHYEWSDQPVGKIRFSIQREFVKGGPLKGGPVELRTGEGRTGEGRTGGTEDR